MLRLLLLALGGWAAWRYRDRIKESVTQLPQVQAKAQDAFGEATTKIKEGLQAPVTSRPSAVGRGGHAEG